MALAIDASTPAFVSAPNASSSVTTASFSPPAGSVLEIFIANGNSDPSATGVTDNLGAHLTYTKQKQLGITGAEEAEVWTAPVITGGAMTVTANFASTWSGLYIGVIVWTGAASTQAGASASNSSASGTPTVTLASAATDSWVTGSVANGSNITGPTPGAGQTNTFNAHAFSASNGAASNGGWGQANTAAGNSNLTINDTAPTLVAFCAVAYEVQATQAAVVDSAAQAPLLPLMGVPMFGQQPPLPFGLIPDQPPVQTPAGIWLPATTTPSPRNRSSFFVVRGRQVKAVPNQETPVVEQRSPGVRREPPRLSRGARPFPVQPQIAVPAPVIGNRIDSQRGKITSARRGRQWSVVPPQATVVLIWVPRQVPGHRRVILPSRGRVFAPVPAQVTVPVLVFPNRVDSQRSKLAALYRGKRWDVIPPQVVVVSVWVPTFISPNSTFY